VSEWGGGVSRCSAAPRQAVYKTHLDIVHVQRDEASALFSVAADRGVNSQPASQAATLPPSADTQDDAGLLRARPPACAPVSPRLARQAFLQPCRVD